MDAENLKPLLVTVRTGERLSGLGHSKFAELMRDGVVRTVHVGRRRLVVYASLEELARAGYQNGSPAFEASSPAAA